MNNPKTNEFPEFKVQNVFPCYNKMGGLRFTVQIVFDKCRISCLIRQSRYLIENTFHLYSRLA
jgi:hypothetical protein